MKPSISDYMNVFQFLQDYYSYRKQCNPKFSYAAWATELGIKNKSYARFVALGKRPIGPKLQKIFTECLGFSEDEKKIFKVLCLYTQTRSEEERKLLGRELIRLLRQAPPQIELLQHHEMLMSPVVIMIRTLLTFKDLQRTSESLAMVLDIPKHKVQEAIDLLLSLGLARQEQGGSFSSVDKNLKIPDNFASIGIEDFYRKSFQHAIASINVSKESRKYRSWFIAFNEEEFQKFTAASESMVREKILESESDHFQDKRLYQVLMATVPVSVES